VASDKKVGGPLPKSCAQNVERRVRLNEALKAISSQIKA